MHRQSRISKFLFFFFSLILAVIVLLFLSFFSSILSGVSSSISALDNIFSRPSQFFLQNRDNLSHLSDTYKENEELKSKLYDLDLKKNELNRLKRENEDLKKLLEIENDFEASFKETSKVINRNTNAWQDALTISAGSAQGISNNMLAIANGGLIGSVSKVYKNSSDIELLTNVKFSSLITVKIEADNQFIYGVLSGYSNKEGAFIVKQLNTQAVIRKGASVSTSGLGDFPISDIPVGTVLSSYEESSALSNEILVKPAADFSNLNFVMVVGK